MQSAFWCYHASTIMRGLQAGARTIPHRRIPPFPTPAFGIDGGLRQTDVLPDYQYHAWRQGMRARAPNLGKPGIEHKRLFGQSTPDRRPHQHIAAKKEDKISRSDSASLQRDQAEGTGEERAKRLRPETRTETRTRDSPAESLQTGRLLSTPSRLLKLLIPLPTDHPEDRETIAILVHPQQPLSYLERLIQTELSLIKDESGEQRHPEISFIAYQFEDHPIRPRKGQNRKTAQNADLSHDVEKQEVSVSDGKGQGYPQEPQPPNENVNTKTSLSQLQSNGDRDQLYVRWSHATEVGDFIRDAARAGEFIIAIEGAPSGLDQIRIMVPSFDDRTYYLRMRLRKISDRIVKIAEIKHECDKLAHRGGQRVALAGFGVLASWWLLVYKLTFGTSLGWDTMEPVTYLVSLSTLMGGYLWFLYHNREISYRSALDITINTRQKKLYQQKGVDLQLWENLTYEGNALRREIQAISADYDTEWDEKLDELDERVVEALKQKRKERERKDDDRLDDKEKATD